MGMAKGGTSGGRAIKMDTPMEMPSTMHINLKKQKSMDGAADVGEKIHFKGHGKVTSINKDEFGHHTRIDINHIEPTDAE
jgi:hypothetical protein